MWAAALALVSLPSSTATSTAHLAADVGAERGPVGAELARSALPLAATQRAALRAVGVSEAAPLAEGELRALRARSTLTHGSVTAHTPAPTREDTPLRLVAELARARAQAARLARLPHLEAAGYYYGSGFVPGVGVHYIDWRRVGKPFDPAHPAMLLIDATPGHIVRLAGFSYWVHSRAAPAGFAGTADVWHRHRGLCFVDGVLEREQVRRRECVGTWLNGGDLWMLHVWVVRGYANDAGVFAPTNRDLCPAHLGSETYWC